ncbi:MAG: hypothetical protein R2725_14335 [Solirubrobacterales bacterium]
MRAKRRGCGGLLSVLVAAGVLLAACGGGGESSTAAAMSEAEFVAAAEAICERADKRIEAAAGKRLGPGEPSEEELEKFAIAAVVPYTQQIIDGIEGLTPPASLADTVSEMTAEAQSVNDRLKAEPGELAASEDPFAEVSRLARQAGLDACAGE